METMTDKSIPEFAPFGFSLARQLTILLTGTGMGVLRGQMCRQPPKLGRVL